MSKLHKIIFLFFILFAYEAELFAAESVKNADDGAGLYLNTNVNLATAPECILDVASIVAIGVGITTGIAGSISGIASIIKGNALLSLPDPTTITKIKGAAAIVFGATTLATSLAQLTYVAIGGVGFGVCAGSFVRDPMTYFPKTSLASGETMIPKAWEGKMVRTIKNPNNPFPEYKPVSAEDYGSAKCTKDEKNCYFLGHGDSRAEKIIVCARGIVPVGVFNIEGCYAGANRAGWITGVGSSVFSGGGDNDYYDGPKSLLCPEEFRQVWRMPKKNPEPSTGFHKLGCNKGNLKKCTSDEEKYYVNPSYKKNSSLEDFKLTFDRPTCKEGVKKNGKWDPIYINGYKYTISQEGVNLCATLVGLGELPWVQKFKIGCVKSRTSNAMPRCAKSKPIYENYTLNSDGFIDYYGDPIGSGGIILRYDDTPCGNACALSALCGAVGAKFLNAPIPITSYLMGCVKESLNQMTYGCNSLSTGPGGQSEGMLYTVQRRLRIIIVLAMTLSIILFGMQSVLGDQEAFTLKGLSIFVLKLILVIYLTNTHTNKDGITENGMAKYIGFIDTISYSLQSMVMHSVTKNGLCSKIETAKYEVDIPGEGKKDLEYLRVWDLLDCKFAFYFSSGFANVTTGTIKSAYDPYDRPLFYQITAILNVPFRLIVSYIALGFFCLFLLFTIMQICELIICAFLAFSILVVVSPIFVPFILFKSQKQLFDSWVNQVLAYSLYPVLVFAFMGFLFISMDKLLFGDTYFVPTEAFSDGRKITSYAVDGSRDFAGKEECAGFNIANSGAQGIGEIPKGCDCGGVHCMLNASVISTKPSGTFIGKTTGADLYATKQGERFFLVGCLSLMFIMFIYYQLSKEIYGLLNALSGSMRSIIMHQNTTATQRMEGAGTIALGLLRTKPGGKKADGPQTSTGAKNEGDGNKARDALPGFGVESGGGGSLPGIESSSGAWSSGSIPGIGTKKK
jgi:hypothetical protein